MKKSVAIELPLSNRHITTYVCFRETIVILRNIYVRKLY